MTLATGVVRVAILACLAAFLAVETQPPWTSADLPIDELTTCQLVMLSLAIPTVAPVPADDAIP
jgi:hypothetical protein